jgi:hypothetical protein
MRCFLSRSLGLLALVALSGVVGCGGGGTGTVSGKVTYKDAKGGEVPVKGGTVIFNAKSKSVSADINEDGTYTAKDVPVGEAKIAVQTKALGIRAAMGKEKSIPADSPMFKGGKSPEEAARRFVEIPENYEDAQTSGLTYVVKLGPQDHDLPLSGKLGGGSGKHKGSSGGPPK